MTIRDIINLVSSRSSFQKKRLANYIKTCDSEFFRSGDEFVSKYEKMLAINGMSLDYAINSYLKMCNDMVRCQIEFLRTGKYPYVNAEKARENVYENKIEMLSYMVGLGISQFLWPSHYRILTFFKNIVNMNINRSSSYLEIGPGHGLYMEYALIKLISLENVVAIDISPTSLELTRSLITNCLPSFNKRIDYILGDIITHDIKSKFDFVTMGEVLEHVDQPVLLLRKLKTLISPGGQVFISTCANSPANDHVVQFDNVAQIRDVIGFSDLIIVDDLAIPAEPMTVQDAEEKRVSINYCALLR